jgi:dipeptidyl aminopeptidase/acylaminoacyl peptidase
MKTHRRAGFAVLLGALLIRAEVHEHPGGKEIPHDPYIHVVSEADSPVERVYIKSKDGVYVAAAVRKPKGDGPFPVLIYFHGAPGGRGIEQLARWSAGATGGPVWERFLKEGFAVVVADYRNPKDLWAPVAADQVTYVDDGLAVVNYARRLPYADANRITLYGVSLGGSVVAHVLGRTKVHSAILGAPAVRAVLGSTVPKDDTSPDFAKGIVIDEALARKNVGAIQTPVLILQGGADSLKYEARIFHDLMEKAGKPVRMDIYENGYHDFCAGPQGQNRREPLMDSTLEALELSLKFVRGAGAPRNGD